MSVPVVEVAVTENTWPFTAVEVRVTVVPVMVPVKDTGCETSKHMEPTTYMEPDRSLPLWVRLPPT